MTARLNPYLSFRDNARAAMEFYRSVFGGNLEVSNFGDMAMAPGERDMVMHAILAAPNGFVLMGADTPSMMPYQPGTNMSVSLSGDDDAELRGYWDKLSVDASVAMPLEKAPWGDSFGMLTDKFGIPWLVNISTPRQ
jgi:PhnB protein